MIFLLTLFESSRLLSCGFFPPSFSPPRLQRAMCCIWRAGRGNNGNAYCFFALGFFCWEVSEWTMLPGFAMQGASKVWEMHPWNICLHYASFQGSEWIRFALDFKILQNLTSVYFSTPLTVVLMFLHNHFKERSGFLVPIIPCVCDCFLVLLHPFSGVLLLLFCTTSNCFNLSMNLLMIYCSFLQ